MSVEAQEAFAYDPYDKAVLKNPVPYYKELRANHPAYYVEKYDMFVFSRFQDIWDLLGTADNVFIGSEHTVPRPDMKLPPPPPMPSAPPSDFCSRITPTSARTTIRWMTIMTVSIIGPESLLSPSGSRAGYLCAMN